jgi:hypothetical protein
MLGFIVVLGLITLFIGGMAIKLFVLDEAMKAGCGSDPVVVDGEELECFGCPEEKKRECELRQQEETQETQASQLEEVPDESEES